MAGANFLFALPRPFPAVPPPGSGLGGLERVQAVEPVHLPGRIRPCHACRRDFLLSRGETFTWAGAETGEEGIRNSSHAHSPSRSRKSKTGIEKLRCAPTETAINASRCAPRAFCRASARRRASSAGVAFGSVIFSLAKLHAALLDEPPRIAARLRDLETLRVTPRRRRRRCPRRRRRATASGRSACARSRLLKRVLKSSSAACAASAPW